MIIIIDILINTLSSARRENGPIYSFFYIFTLSWQIFLILYLALANISYLILCLGRYLRNAATFKDVRSGEHGLELFKVSLSNNPILTSHL